MLIHGVISIHTPARGVTQWMSWAYHSMIHFNPHSREGSDRNFIQKLQTFLFHLHNYRT